MNESNIRNFAIIAHIDHGKSTLADRFLELTGTIEKRKMREQFLDSMDLERERGITIKMQPVRMMYHPNRLLIAADFKPIHADLNISGNQKRNQRESVEVEYILNLIDTPGHVDFSYEVSRALAAVEGVVLLVDATKGVQAQTLANVKIAVEQGLTIVPAINKIDLPVAMAGEVEREIEDMLLSFDYAAEKIYRVSAKTGEGVEELLDAVVERIPAPSPTPNTPRTSSEEGENPPLTRGGRGGVENPLRALIFDSIYDSYRGVIAHVRIKDGRVSKRDKLFFMATGLETGIKELGYFSPELTPADSLEEGEIGYIATGLKETDKVKIGDTVTAAVSQQQTAVSRLPGYHEPQPLVFASVFPEEGDKFDELKDAVSQLKLNDSSLHFEPDYSQTLGRGIKFGFLGMLHMDVILERLRREFDVDTVVTSPSVIYKVQKKNGEEEMVYSPSKFPDAGEVLTSFEPYALVEILTPPQYFSSVMSLLKDIRGENKGTETLGRDIFFIKYEAPLSEIITDFYDRLKSVSSGFASMSYNLTGFREADAVKMEILLAGDEVESLARVVPKSRVEAEGKKIVEKLKDVIPREQFAVIIQAKVGGKIVARETKSAMRKDVTGYLYGGDYSRKKKLLEKQKKGKKRLRERGRVHLDSETFMKLFK